MSRRSSKPEIPAEPRTSSMATVVQLMRAAACQTGLSLHETKLLVVLASFADHRTLEAYPATRTLAGMTGIELRNLSRAMRALVAKGLVEVVEAGTKRRATRYRLSAENMLRDVSGDVSETSLQTAQRRLYGRLRDVSGDSSETSRETTELPMKGHTKWPQKVATEVWPASRSARAPLKAPSAPRRGQLSVAEHNAMVIAELLKESGHD